MVNAVYPRARDGALVAVDPVAEAGGEKPKKKKTAAPRAPAPDQKAMPPRLPARARKPRASWLTRPPAASGFDRRAPKLPHSSMPAPPDRNRRPRGLARAHEKRRQDSGRGPFSEQIQGAFALGQFQKFRAQAKASPPPSCRDGGGWRRPPPPPDLQGQKRKRRRASSSASPGDHDSPRAASAPARPRIKSTVAAAGNARAHTRHSPPRPAVSIGARRSYPIARCRRPRIETAGRGASRARTRNGDKIVGAGKDPRSRDRAVDQQHPRSCAGARPRPPPDDGLLARTRKRRECGGRGRPPFARSRCRSAASP